MSLCLYYTAPVAREKTWFFVAALRSYEHLAFDRTRDTSTGLFEFFVPADHEVSFVALMEGFKKLGIITEYSKAPNRLADPAASL